VSRIPDDHLAARDLQRQLQDAAVRLHPKARRRRRMLGRGTALGLIAVAVGVGGATAGKVLTDDGNPVKGDRGQPGDLIRVPDDARLSSARVPDPAGGLVWGARTYVNQEGATCVVVGRVRGGELGVLKKGAFHALPSSAPGVCGDPDGREPMVAVRTYDAGPARTLLFGAVSRRVSSATFTANGRATAIPIADDGVYLAIFEGHPNLHGAKLSFTTADGAVVRTFR
jgi:hypothetical protein